MIGVDTNILIRFLTGDDEKQAHQVYEIFKKAESKRDELFVPFAVVLELIWVLESVYETSKAEILESISDLLLMPILKFENHSVLQKVIYSSQENNHDLSDLLIAHSARVNACDSVLTFDKKASKFSLFQLVK